MGTQGQRGPLLAVQTVPPMLRKDLPQVHLRVARRQEDPGAATEQQRRSGEAYERWQEHPGILGHNRRIT